MNLEIFKESYFVTFNIQDTQNKVNPTEGGTPGHEPG